MFPSFIFHLLFCYRFCYMSIVNFLDETVCNKCTIIPIYVHCVYVRCVCVHFVCVHCVYVRCVCVRFVYARILDSFSLASRDQKLTERGKTDMTLHLVVR